jgi:hypothetical protein
MAAAIFSTVKSKKVGKTIIIRQLITKKRKEVRITGYHPPMDQNFSLKMPA